MLDSDSFSIICSFLKQADILSFSFSNKTLFEFYYSKLHPKVKELFLRYGCIKYDNQYSVVTRFSKYDDLFKDGTKSRELFLQACIFGNYLLLEDILKIKPSFLKRYDIYHGLKWVIYNKNIFSFRAFMLSNKICIEGVISFLAENNYLLFFDDVIEYIVDSFPEGYDFEKLSDKFVATSYSHHYIYYKILTHEKIAKRTKVRLIHLSMLECLHCMIRWKQIEIIMKKNKDFEYSLSFSLLYGITPHCNFSDYCEDKENIHEFPRITDDAVNLMKKSRKKFNSVVIGLLSKMKKDARSIKCKVSDKAFTDIIESNKKILEKCYKMKCRMCGLNGGKSGDKTHKEVISNIITSFDKFSSYSYYKGISSDFNENYSTNYNCGSNYLKYDTPEDFEGCYQSFEYSEYTDSTFLSFEILLKGNKYPEFDCCKSYEKKNLLNDVYHVTFGKIGQYIIDSASYIYEIYKEYCQSDERERTENFIFSKKIKNCYCSIPSKQLRFLSKECMLATLALLKRNEKIEDDRWNYFLENFVINHSKIHNYPDIPFTLEDKKKILKIFFFRDLEKNSCIKTDYSFLGKMKIDNTNSYIVDILTVKERKKIPQHARRRLHAINNICDFFDYPIEHSTDVSKALIKLISLAKNSFYCSSKFMNYVLEKELSKSNPGTHILKNPYACFYARHKFGDPLVSKPLYQIKPFLNEKDKKDFDKFIYKYTIQGAIDIGTIEALENIRIVENISRTLILKSRSHGPKFMSALLEKINELQLNSDILFDSKTVIRKFKKFQIDNEIISNMK